MDVAGRDLALMAATLGRSDRHTFVAMLARAKLDGHHVDVQVEGHGNCYTLTATVVNGESIIGDGVFDAPCPDDELLRLALLRLRVETLLAGNARWKARMMVARRAQG
jgi:hypothetical protein